MDWAGGVDVEVSHQLGRETQLTDSLCSGARNSFGSWPILGLFSRKICSCATAPVGPQDGPPEPISNRWFHSKTKLKEINPRSPHSRKEREHLLAHFIGIHLALVAVWIGLNGGIAISQFRFDPFPYPLLTAVFSFESVLLTSFVLIRQTRMSERADRRSHLDLQINLLTEKEMTKIAQDAQLICHRLGVEAVHSEVLELSKDTVVYLCLKSKLTSGW